MVKMTAYRDDDDGIEIIPFEPRFQDEVVQLFVDGLTPEDLEEDLGATVAKHQSWYVNYSISEIGKMHNIWESFMKRVHEDETTPSNFNYFWVAIDNLKQVVVGHVGVIMSTYDKSDNLIYHRQDLDPSNVCQLVTISVHREYRGRHIGRRLCEAVEKYALENGMKQIVLDTLDKMQGTRRFYEGCGFKLAKVTKIPIEPSLGPGEWEDLYLVHYIKLLYTRTLKLLDTLNTIQRV